MTPLYRLATLTAALFLGIPLIPAQVPPRTDAGQALQVPEAQLDSGFVYHLWPGEDTQLVLTSEAPLQKVVATTSRAVGYLLVPFEWEEGTPPLLDGAIRVPVASLTTGIRRVDRTVRGNRFLNLEEHPEITFELDSISEVVAGEIEETVRAYRLKLHGRLGVKGELYPLEIPAELRFYPSSRRAMARNVGDMATVQASIQLRPTEKGWQLPSPALADRIGDELNVEIYFLFNTITPDKSGDPRDDPQIFRKQVRFVTLLRDLDQPAEAYAYGERFRSEIWDDAKELRRLAEAVMDTDGVQQRDYRFALETALRANEIEGRDFDVLTLLARIEFEKGESAAALKWQQQAVEAVAKDDQRREAASQQLEIYRKAVAATGS